MFRIRSEDGLPRSKCMVVGVCLCACLTAARLALGVSPRPCGPDRVDAEVRVEHVLDGDTVLLSDGHRLRLIGIDAPELGHGATPAQPMAKRAKALLARLVDSSATLQLRYDEERVDGYGRLLAHAFVVDDGSVQATILQQGLATQFVMPPNLWNMACYASAETTARLSSNGVWSLRQYQPVKTSELTPTDRGVRVLIGQVRWFERSAHGLWLNLSDHVALRVPSEQAQYFEDLSLAALVNHNIQVRGWLERARPGWRMTLRHPQSLQVLD